MSASSIMDIKKKFKLLIGKQEPLRSPVEEPLSPEQLSGDPAVAKLKQEPPRDPHADQEILESIEKTYYNPEDFDTSEYELGKLPEQLALQQINEDRQRLREQLDVVCKKVSELVLQNHSAYEAELERVMELQRTLQLASVICANGRRELLKARESFTATSLGLLANYRKRHHLMGLLKSLRTIKTLQRTDLRLREMVEEEDYSGAIQLCLECQKAASTYRHYKCISELSSKLQDTLVMIEEQLDVALSKTCRNFDYSHYEKVQRAYRLLDKTPIAMDQLHMHYASEIHNTAFTIVLGYVELYSGTGNTNFQKKQYSDLCKHVTVESFAPCLTDLCKALWEVMTSYFQTIQWHEGHYKSDGGQQSEMPTLSIETSFNRQYIKQKLQHGLGRIWQDVQQKVKTYILGTDLSVYKFEEFIQFLDLVNRLIKIGEEFCGSRSEGLQDSLKQQSLNYFRNHHRARMDELRMFLENEGWELCPVKSSFNFLQLLEFRFMKNWDPTVTSELLKTGDGNDNVNPLPTSKSCLVHFGEKRNPFDIQPEEEEHEDVFTRSSDRDTFEDGHIDSDSDSDIPEELKQDFIDELTGETQLLYRQKSRSKLAPKFVPIVTNTTLNVLRVMGRYMKMMTVLKPIAFDVITCMSQLFDYYMHTVFSFFGSHGPEINDHSLNNRLKITLQRIYESLIIPDSVGGLPGVGSEDRKDKISQAHLSPVVDLRDRQKLFGLAERIVAAESLVFLSEQFELLHVYLESMIPQNKKAFLQQFYSQTIKMAAELRKPIYRVVSAQAIDYNSLVQQMCTVKWDVKDIMSQHNGYVDGILKNFEDFKLKLSDVGKRVPITKCVNDTLWEHCIRLANRMFVEGYASSKKCSNEGRAWMQLDFQQFLTKLEKFVDIRPIPDREFVEIYIKAYYLPEMQLEIWLQDHKEYSNRQLLALITSVDHINKKARQRLMGLVEDFEKVKR